MPAVKSSAVAAVASELGCSAGHTPASGEIADQPDLLRDFEAETDLFADQPIAPPVKRGPGRPVGSVSRTTKQLQSYLVARGYRDPAEFLAALVTADTRELAAKLGIEDRAEVLKIQRSAAVDLMPYFHQRQGPTEAPREPQARPLVMILEAGAGSALRAGDLAMSINDVEQYQGHSDIDANASHGDASHDED